MPKGIRWSTIVSWYTIDRFEAMTTNSLETRTWLADHPHLHHVVITNGACWLNLQEGLWRLFRRDALAMRSFANPSGIDLARCVATTQLNIRAKPWVWERPPAAHRHRRRAFCYRV